jgi:hypothetical protein
MVQSWQEQRDWCVAYPIQALQQAAHPLGPQMQKAYSGLFASARPDTTGFTPVTPGSVYDAGTWRIGFDSFSGAINVLSHTFGTVSDQTVWAQPGEGSCFVLPWYVTLSAGDYAVFTGIEPNGYYPLGGQPPGYFTQDFGKPNVSSASPIHSETAALAATVLKKEGAAVTRFLIKSHFSDVLHSNYGAPDEMWTTLDVPKGTGNAPIGVTFEIFGKTPTRLPEGLFLRFNASNDNGTSQLSLAVRSVGGSIDPLDVVPGGNHHMHGFAGGAADFGGGIAFTKHGKTLLISSDSASVASVGRPWPLPSPVFANSTDPSEGMGFMLTANTCTRSSLAQYEIPAPESIHAHKARSRWLPTRRQSSVPSVSACSHGCVRARAMCVHLYNTDR